MKNNLYKLLNYAALFTSGWAIGMGIAYSNLVLGFFGGACLLINIWGYHTLRSTND